MWNITLDVGQYLIWYYLLGLGILLFSIWASYIHKTALPLYWGLTIGLIVILLQSYLAPILFGVLNYNYITETWQFVITGIFTVMWFGYIGLTLWNNLIYGEAWK